MRMIVSDVLRMCSTTTYHRRLGDACFTPACLVRKVLCFAATRQRRLPSPAATAFDPPASGRVKAPQVP